MSPLQTFAAGQVVESCTSGPLSGCTAMQKSFPWVAVLLVVSGCFDLSDEHYRFDCPSGSCDAADAGKVDAGPVTPPRDGGADHDGGCAVTCTPAAPVCTDHTTLLTSRTRSCSGTQCQYEQTSTTGTEKCENGACANEPCAGLVCDMPPAATCVDAQTLKVYSSAGTCSQGTCSYATVSVTCANGCSNGACVGNPCAGKTCTLPTASVCVGSSVRTYQSPGVCDGASGQCAYSSSEFSVHRGLRERRLLERPLRRRSMPEPA